VVRVLQSNADCGPFASLRLMDCQARNDVDWEHNAFAEPLKTLGVVRAYRRKRNVCFSLEEIDQCDIRAIDTHAARTAC
jgi:hypothetical protein